jgi:hypothetical protein
MSDLFVIQWKSQVNGRAGKGTKAFSREEAEQLSRELNEEYPDILHEPVPWQPPPLEPEPSEEEANVTMAADSLERVERRKVPVED